MCVSKRYLISDWTINEQSVGDDPITTIGSPVKTNSHSKWMCVRTLNKLRNMSISCTEDSTCGGNWFIELSNRCGLVVSLFAWALPFDLLFIFGMTVWKIVPNKCSVIDSPASIAGQWQILSQADSKTSSPSSKYCGAINAHIS